MYSNYSIYTQIIVDEANKRGIKDHDFFELSKNHCVLEFKDHKEYISQSRTNRTGHVIFKLLYSKFGAYKLLKEAGFPVPDTMIVENKEEAIQFLNRHKNIVIKPDSGSGGYNVVVGVKKKNELLKAFNNIESVRRRVVVQEMKEGLDHRVLIVNYKYIYGIKKKPAFIVGDGTNNIRELIDKWNDTLEIKNRQIRIDDELLLELKSNNLTLDYTPKENEEIILSKLANAHKGGVSIDITDNISEKIKEVCKSVCKEFSCPVLGIDIISKDITKEKEPFFMIELNPHPGLTIHHFPTIGKKRNPAEKIIDMLFPETMK